MSKLKYILPLTLLISCFYIIPAKADINDYQTVIAYYRDNYDGNAYLVAFYDTPSLVWDANYLSWMVSGNFAGYQQPPQEYSSIQACIDAYNSAFPDNYFTYTGLSSGFGWNPNYMHIQMCIIKGSINNMQDMPSLEIIDYTSPTPPAPEPGSSWISDLWDWFMYFMGWGDDPSIIEITGGDKVETEIVTPTPSPSPTPIPTPTPYTLNVIDPSTGQPVYTITGIPSNTYNIYGGDTTNNGSDFDIFDVDLKIGDGGTSKPKDDINNVLRTNNEYIQEMDVSAVKDSFSVLPTDWFIMLGVLASMPIIAGIISKMLK